MKIVKNIQKITSPKWAPKRQRFFFYMALSLSALCFWSCYLPSAVLQPLLLLLTLLGCAFASHCSSGSGSGSSGSGSDDPPPDLPSDVPPGTPVAFDAFVVNEGSENRVYLNDASGSFTASNASSDTKNSTGAALGDLDNDGNLDAFVVNYDSENRIYLNDASGGFTASDASTDGGLGSRGVALGYLDDDSDIDAFVVNYRYHNDRSYLNDLTGGSFGFTTAGVSTDQEDASAGVALGDLDDDGNIDAFVVTVSEYSAGDYGTPESRVYLNDASGGFAESNASSDNNDSTGVALGDLDDDGDLDAFVVNKPSPAYADRGTPESENHVYLNQLDTGSFSFTASDASSDENDSRGVALGDLDGDGDLDAFVVNNGGKNRVYLNQLDTGSFSFTASDASSDENDSRGVALGDLDNDGDLDAFVANHGQKNRIYFNQLKESGTFSFTVVDASSDTNNSTGVVLGNLD